MSGEPFRKKTMLTITVEQFRRVLVTEWNRQKMRSVLRILRNRGFPAYAVLYHEECKLIKKDREALEIAFNVDLQKGRGLYVHCNGGYVKFMFDIERMGNCVAYYNGNEEFKKVMDSIK
ncbi:MAG: hypothetical protein ACO4AA_02180 [Aquiluna sp.]